MSAMYWLSFCDPDKPKGSQFLGVAIVRAPGAVEAAALARLYGCNPGGEVRITQIANESLVGARWMNRLLSKADVDEFERGLIS